MSKTKTVKRSLMRLCGASIAVPPSGNSNAFSARRFVVFNAVFATCCSSRDVALLSWSARYRRFGRQSVIVHLIRVPLVIPEKTSSNNITDMDYDTRLIMLVKQFPELYDNSHSDFKNKEVRQAIWADIAYQLRNECDEKSVRVVRSRWKSLRDSYVKETKHKLSLGSGSARPKKDWRYSQEMSFLTPHLAISHPKALKTEEFKVNEDNLDEQQPMETYFVDVDSFQENPEGGHFMGALLDYSAEKFGLSQTLTDITGASDDIDSFFKGVAEVVKRLRPINQVKIQKEIVNLVLDMKLKEVQENNNDQ